MKSASTETPPEAVEAVVQAVPVVPNAPETHTKKKARREVPETTTTTESFQFEYTVPGSSAKSGTDVVCQWATTTSPVSQEIIQALADWSTQSNTMEATVRVIDSS